MSQDFSDYFKSQEHNDRMKSALDDQVRRLGELGKQDLLASLSEAIGTLYGVAHFFKSLGLNHIAKQCWKDSGDYIEKK